MEGFIGNKQVFSQFGVIWREFGPRCAARCIGAMLRRRPTTFLDVAFDTSVKGRRVVRGRPRIAARV
jgi:hypothetical protein